jgi:hypothetical protein
MLSLTAPYYLSRIDTLLHPEYIRFARSPFLLCPIAVASEGFGRANLRHSGKRTKRGGSYWFRGITPGVHRKTNRRALSSFSFGS